METYAEDNGISLKFHYIQDVNVFFEKIKNNEKGFRLYDIFFIDYSLSSGIVGSQLITDLRAKNMDSDILFYSSDKESEIRYLLINKNARRLTSLSNIRGYLMDQTSENDFTVQSYILYKFDKLTSVQKQKISNILLEYIKTKKHEFTEKVDDQIANLEKDGIKNINKILGLSSELFPISLKYEIFAKMLEYDSELTFDDVTVEQYLSEIVKARNTLAHKKLDVCRTQEYILYYDTMRQLEARKCPEDCIEHSDNYKISINEWNELRKKIHAFGNEVDETQKKLQKIEAETN